MPQNLIKDWSKFQKKVARMWDSKLPAYGFWSIEGHELSQAHPLVHPGPWRARPRHGVDEPFARKLPKST
ncbi:MAG: hypothetical protein IPO07_26310 [Haliscomenobacter sp.]|nr:hypothetical protein [Haliscomenobacter sp.]MBK9491922.1 hypothetical protein [Haliscomenobacter sp.]